MTLRDQIKRTIISLYNDRIYPDFQSVKKRHEERYKAEPLTLDTLMHLCNQNNPDFSIEKAEDRPVPGFRLAHPPKSFRGFVSPTDPVDYYGPQLWDAFETEINSLMLYEPSCYTFPGGRYGTARALKERNLRFLNGYSLGELCHIVQLAIDKEILAYGKSGSVVPFKVSSKAEKDANARDKRPTFAGHRRQAKEGSEQSRRDTTDSSGGDHCSSHHSGSSHLSPRSEQPTREDFIGTWGRLREVLFTLLTTTEWKHRILLLSNLKNEIRRHFNGVVLSETALGHTKLIDMVQDPNLADLVRVDWRRNNPVLKLEPGATLKRGTSAGIKMSGDSPKEVSSIATPDRSATSVVETTGEDGSTNTVSPLDRAIEIDAKHCKEPHPHHPVISLKNTFLQYAADSEEAEGLQKSRRVKTAPDEYLLSTADRAITGLHINHYQITPLDFPFIPSVATETDYDLTNATDGGSIVPPPPGLEPTVSSPLSPLPALAHPANGVSDALATYGSSTDLTDALPDLELLLSQISSDPPLMSIGGTTLNASAAEFVPMRSQSPRPSSDAFAQHILKGLSSNNINCHQLPPTPAAAAASHGIQLPVTPGGILLTQAMTEVETHMPSYPWMSRTPGGYTIGTLLDACGSPTGAMAAESCEEVLRSPLRVTPHHG